jgi:hypothetical protein
MRWLDFELLTNITAPLGELLFPHCTGIPENSGLALAPSRSFSMA